MLKIVLLKGLPGSGKSTWAKAEVARHPNQIARVNKDDLRKLLHVGKYSKINERLVEDARDAVVRAALTRGQSVIVDDTNLAGSHEERLREIAKQFNVGFEIKSFLDTSIETCIQRDLERGKDVGVVGEKVIRRMYNDHVAEPVGFEQRIPRNPELPDAVIVDIDGTLAHSTGRGPYESSRYHEDAFDEGIADLVYRFRRDGVKVIVCSGRDEDFRDVTETWMKHHEFEWDLFLMRSSGDVRNDAIVKGELYDQSIKDKYSVLFVLDDRDRVIAEWRRRGLLTLQVAYGDF